MSNKQRQIGMSLIEVVVFIIVLGIGLAGILVLYNQVTISSVDPMVRKQALAIASSLLEEIELQAFTYCDPDDSDVFTATNTAGCNANAPNIPEGIGPETVASVTESRYADPRFDNVNDYHNFSMGRGTPNPDIKTLGDTIIAELADYSVLATVAVIDTASGELPNVTVANDALRVTVTVTHPTGVRVSLQGYRLRYAPNSP